MFAPLVILTILFGVYPKPVLDMSAASVAQLLENYQAAVAPKKAAEMGGGAAATVTQMSAVPSLLPALPEIVLAIGAMVLILYGAFAGERVTQTVNWAAFGLLIVAGADRPVAAVRQARHLRRRLHPRRLRARAEDPRADRLGGHDRAGARLFRGGAARRSSSSAS